MELRHLPGDLARQRYGLHVSGHRLRLWRHRLSLYAPGGPMGGNRWRCNAPCPATQPNPGDTCSTLRMTQCPYAGTTCLCGGGQFFCD